jgi:hypothetical protein
MDDLDGVVVSDHFEYGDSHDKNDGINFYSMRSPEKVTSNTDPGMLTTGTAGVSNVRL